MFGFVMFWFFMCILLFGFVMFLICIRICNVLVLDLYFFN
jgi:hypothetical protein